MTTSAVAPTTTARGSRLVGIDAARGIALLGMFTAHLTNVDQILDWGDPDTWWVIAAGRSSVLFAVLAGVSLAIVTGRDLPVRGRALTVARRRITARGVLIVLIGFGLILLETPVAVILPTYGILFVLLLPALSWPRVALVSTAAGLALVALPLLLLFLPALAGAGPATQQVLLYYPLPVFAAYLLVGLAVGRCDLTSRRVLGRLAGGGAALALVVYSLGEAMTPGGSFFYGQDAERLRDYVFASEPHSSTLVDMLGSIGVALAVIGVCGLLARRLRGSRDSLAPSRGRALAGVPLRLLAGVGAMPLTIYSGHLVVIALLNESAYLATLTPVGQAWLLVAFAAGALALGAVFRGRTGPLEWIVAAVARGVGGRLPAS